MATIAVPQKKKGQIRSREERGFLRGLSCMDIGGGE